MKSVTSLWFFHCLLGTYFMLFSSVCIVDFEQVNVSWVTGSKTTMETPKQSCTLF